MTSDERAVQTATNAEATYANSEWAKLNSAMMTSIGETIREALSDGAITGLMNLTLAP